MEALLEAIRAATATDATDEARIAGATACRTILAALDAKPGESFAAPNAAETPASASIAGAVSALRGLPPDQLLDLAIARLRAALPADAAPPPPRPMKFHIVNLPRVLPPRTKP